MGLLGGLSGQETGRFPEWRVGTRLCEAQGRKEGFLRDTIRLVVESTDSEDSPYRYNDWRSPPLPRMKITSPSATFAPGSGAANSRLVWRRWPVPWCRPCR